MSKWGSIRAYKNLILHKTDKAYLIKLPKRETRFWIPKTWCEFVGENGYLIEFRFPDDKIFDIFQSGQNKEGIWDKFIDYKMNVTEIRKVFKKEIETEEAETETNK